MPERAGPEGGAVFARQPEQFGGVAADGVVRGDAEQAGGGGVPVQDAAVAVEGEGGDAGDAEQLLVQEAGRVRLGAGGRRAVGGVRRTALRDGHADPLGERRAAPGRQAPSMNTGDPW
ncbi:hypothetical protein BJF79_05285 [Actinomadura sp. CNU-125]|nr:hypothetical protein [Actinomadura sp. CNU-125]OLT38154.1 hypothetical protein BJF79_05285 [Actinomadura sp. CNU-125]